MDHDVERRNMYEKYIQRYRDSVIDQLVDNFGEFSEDEVVRVLGVLDVNSMAVRVRGGPYRARGLFPVASLMNHSCVCNSRNIVTDDRLETRATVPISAGEPVTMHYVSPLLPIHVRSVGLCPLALAS